MLPMVESEARATVNQIKEHFGNIRRLIYDLYQRKGWESLGYQSWRECVTAEFEESQSKLYQQLDAAKIEAIIFHNCGNEIGAIPEGRLRPPDRPAPADSDSTE